jgi:hypothetical protein
MTDPRSPALVEECNILATNTCTYTAAQLYIWLRAQRCVERTFVVLPIIFGAISTWYAFDDTVPYSKWITATCALLAGLLPAIYKALELDVHVETISRAAGEYTNLRDRFRQLSKLGPTMSVESFQEAFDTLMRRLEDVRRLGLAPPERFFLKARAKIKAGHYDPDGPTPSSDGQPGGSQNR